MHKSAMATEFNVIFILSKAAGNTQLFGLLTKTSEVFGRFR
jgi:hypothetical protein